MIAVLQTNIYIVCVFNCDATESVRAHERIITRGRRVVSGTWKYAQGVIEQNEEKMKIEAIVLFALILYDRTVF